MGVAIAEDDKGHDSYCDVNRCDPEKDSREVNCECENERQEDESNNLHDVHGSNGWGLRGLQSAEIQQFRAFLNVFQWAISCTRYIKSHTICQ